MNELLITVLFLLNRYVHMVAATVLIGGTLFYEMVVPVAIADLKNEQQLAVFGRARWVFRWIVLTCAAALLASGAFSVYRNWNAYSGDEEAQFASLVATAQSVRIEGLAPWQHPRTWMIGHALLGLAGLVVAVSVVIPYRPPNRPIRRLRLSLMLLLIAIFLGSATRNARLRLLETINATNEQPTVAHAPPTTGEN